MAPVVAAAAAAPQGVTAGQIGLILMVACLVAIACRRWRLPYSAGLVAAGMGLALAGIGTGITLPPRAIYSFLLPPVIFEGALQLRWKPFRAALPMTVSLAVPGLLLAMLVVTIGMHVLGGWALLPSAVFASLIAATDPVSVIALFREMRVDARLSMLVEAESLLNDGTASVAFVTVLALAAGGASGGAGGAAVSLVRLMLGGLGVGALVGGLTLLVAWRTDDHLVEITLTTIAAYGAFLAAERLGCSGVMAAMAAGLMVGNLGMQGVMSEEGQRQVASFWEYAAFLANSILFILIGGYEAGAARWGFSAPIMLAVLLVLLGRAAAVYPVCAALRRTRHRVPVPHQHILVWGGLRGALALALALAVPDGLAGKDGIVAATFATVAFSVFAQGLSVPALVRFLGAKA